MGNEEKMQTSFIKLVFVLTAVLGASGSAAATPFYRAGTDTFLGGACFQQGAGSVTCSTDETFTNPLPGTTQAFARASSSTLAMSVSLEMAGNPQLTRERQTMAFASMAFDDFIVSGPSSATFAVAAVNLDVHGFFNAAASGPFARTVSSMVLEVAVESAFGGMPFRRGNVDMTADSRAPQTTFIAQGDFFLPFNIPLGTSNFPFVSLPFVMPVGREFRVGVALRGDVASTIGNFGEASSSGSLNLLNTLNFPASSPVFSLPDGFTLNSVQAQIEDNRWVGGQPSSVPEPGFVALLSLALFALAFRRRHLAN
jgi:PEP-CTERM motif-containing protein